MTWTGAELRAAREAAGVSLTGLARTAHFSKGHLSNVESGRRGATSDVVLAYEQAVGDFMALHRRQVLVAGASLGGAVFTHGGVSDWHPDPELSERMVHASSSGRIDLGLADRITGALAEQRRAEDVKGGRDLWPAVRSQLDAVTRLLPRSSGADADRLLLIAAEHAHWLSWVAAGDDRRGPALRWLDLANGWATDAGSADMLSWIARVRSMYTLMAGDSARALRTAEVAYQLPDISPGAASIATHAAALAAAAVGRRDQALRLADEAHALAERVPHAEDRPPWLYWLDPVRARLQRADAAYAANDWSTAAAMFQECIGEVAHMPRDHAYYAERLAVARQRV